jgi:ribosomal protein S18 acetylase RimI-like enzyme
LEAKSVETTNLIVEDQPNESDLKFLENSIYQFNMKQTGFYDGKELAIFVRDEQGEIGAGLSGFTWGSNLYIAFLWVKEDWRGQGYGSRLLAAAEKEAIARGCRQASLNTHSFQAPDFYPRFGYEVIGVLEDYPLGHRHIYYRKSLQ